MADLWDFSCLGDRVLRGDLGPDSNASVTDPCGVQQLTRTMGLDSAGF